MIYIYIYISEDLQINSQAASKISERSGPVTTPNSRYKRGMGLSSAIEGSWFPKKNNLSRCNCVTFLVLFFCSHRLHLDVGCWMLDVTSMG